MILLANIRLFSNSCYLGPMDTLAILAVIAGVIGIIGSIVPGLPGPPVSWAGMLLAFLSKGLNSTGESMSLALLIVFLAVTVVVTILDYVIPAKFTKLTGGSKAAATGSLIGLFAGMIFTPVGMIAGALLGAFIAEMMVENKTPGASLKSALGAFLGFICGTGIKLIASAVMMYYIIVFAW